MTRFETIIVALAAFVVAAVHAPAFSQSKESGRVVFDGPDGASVTKQVPTDVKNGKVSRNKKAPVAPPPPPQPKEPTFLAEGDFSSTKDKARESAIRAAVEKLHEHLAQQDPPITKMPSDRRSTELVRSMLLNDQEKVIEQKIEIGGKEETMYKMTVAVRVEPRDVRELRSHERASEALWVLAGLGGLAGVLALFFRIDAWTKGYLTTWLVLGTVGAGALLGGLWWMAK